MAVLGAVFNLSVYYPLRNRSYLPVLISTIGASIFLSNSVLALYGSRRTRCPAQVVLVGQLSCFPRRPGAEVAVVSGRPELPRYSSPVKLCRFARTSWWSGGDSN